MIHYPGSIGSVSDHPGAIQGRSTGDRGLAETSDGREMSQYVDFVSGSPMTAGEALWRPVAILPIQPRDTVELRTAKSEGTDEVTR